MQKVVEEEASKKMTNINIKHVKTISREEY